MLIRFVVENFLSFRDELEFNMLAGNFRNHKHHIYEDKLKLLRSAAIYGSNGAGKSNFVKAMEFFQNLVETGSVDQSINKNKFKLDVDKQSKPVYFEIELIVDSKAYRYGIELDKSIVLSEWLVKSGVNKKDIVIFEREFDDDGKPKISFHNKYQKTSKQKLLIELLKENLLKKNELLLAKNETLGIDIISKFKEKILNDIIIIHPESRFNSLVAHFSLSDTFKNFSNSLLKTFDTGIEELSIENFTLNSYFGEDDEEKVKEIHNSLEDEGDGLIMHHNGDDIYCIKEQKGVFVKKLMTSHIDDQGSMTNFDIQNESDGTKRLLDFLPAIKGVLNNEFTFIIDEIDNSLHPTLLKSLISKIMKEENTSGQLIFTTHESNLLDLDIFRQDEIWFVEKDKRGSSIMYSLSDYKPRYDLNIQKGYLKGRFGAIPFLADLEKLKWKNYDSQETRLQQADT